VRVVAQERGWFARHRVRCETRDDRNDSEGDRARMCVCDFTRSADS
jgi:hypothetical protein